MALFTTTRALPLVALLAAAAFTGCKKDSTDVKPPIAVPTAPEYILPRLPDATNGRLLTITHDFRFYEAGVELSDKYPTPLQSVIYQTAMVMFRDTPGPQAGSTYVDGGEVKVNGVALAKGADNIYSKTDNFNFNQGLQYDIAGNGGVTAFAYKVATPQPTYTGNIPTKINRKLTLTIPLGSSNISGADSILVVVRSGAEKLVKKVSYLKPDATATPSVTFTSAELLTLNEALAETNTAFVQVMVFRNAFQPLVQGGRSYAITREAVVSVPVMLFTAI